MQFFEVLLMLLNTLTLFLLSGKQPGRVWLWSTSVNLLVFFLHGIFEGFRYQMIFSYLYVLLLTAITLITMRFRIEGKIPRILQFVVTGISFILLSLTALLAYALPVFHLPKPSGSYAVGTQYFHLIDETRANPFLDPSTQKRELMIKIYYPAKADASKPFAPYFHRSRELLRLLTTGYNMPAFLFDHLSLVKTTSKEGLEVSDHESTYPLILFSHGAGTTMETQTSQSQDLASHGYIVIAIDHTYVSAGTIFPDHIVSAREASTNFDVVEPAEIITQIMADDASFVIDQLTEMNEGKIQSPFMGRLDLEKIGAMGHSVGGAVAYNLAINDRRVKAAVDLDGVVFVTPHGNAQEVVPFLMLANDKYHVQAIEDGNPLMKPFDELEDVDRKITIEMYGSRGVYDDAYATARRNVEGLTEVLQASGNLFTIEGSDHMKFTDIGLFIGLRPLRELIGIGGKTDPARCLEITQALTAAFFDRYLKGNTSQSIETLLRRYPELKQVELK